MTAGFDSETIKDILSNRDAKVFNFSESDSYILHLKYLERVILPQGTIDLARNIPNEDIEMVATTTIILVDSSLHPAIQYLFLQIAQKIDKAGANVFKRTGGFPAKIDQGIPLSEVAEKYYDKGPPILNSYLPYWASSLVDRIWFVLFASVAIAYPIMKLCPNFRIFYSGISITECYKELIHIDSKTIQLESDYDRQTLLNRIERLDDRLQNLWVSEAKQRELFFLKNNINHVRSKISLIKFGNKHLISSNSKISKYRLSATKKIRTLWR